MQFYQFFSCMLAEEQDSGLVTEQYSRGFLVGGGSVRPRYGLFSASNLRLYFCLPPRTRSRRTPGLKNDKRGNEMKKGIFSRSDFEGYQIHGNNRLRKKIHIINPQSITLEMWGDDQKITCSV